MSSCDCPCVCGYQCQWMPVYLDRCVSVPGLVLPLLPIRRNTPALFPQELCGPEWVNPQPQLLCLVRMLRLPPAQGCRGGMLSEIPGV